jgi:hypothetical protein
MLVAVQGGAGNAAVGRLVTAGGAADQGMRDGKRLRVARAPLQRVGLDDGPAPGSDLLAELSKMNQQQKIEKLQQLVKGGSDTDIALVWGSIANGGDAYAVAKANPDLFKASVEKCGRLVTDLPAFKEIEAKFKGDVEALALSYMESNRAVVMAEMDKLGAHADEETDKNPTAEQQHELHEVQKWAKLLADCQKALEGMLDIPVGYAPNEPGNVRGTFVVESFNPEGPPHYLTLPSDAHLPESQKGEVKTKDWAEVKKNWDDVSMLKSICEQKSPALAFMGDRGSGGSSEKTGETAGADLATARKQIGQGLKELIGRIEKAVPMVGTALDYEDFVPIHQQLFSGQKGASGQNWGDPVEQALAKQLVKNADANRMLVSLGLGTLSAAAFILAPFTGGLPLVALLMVGFGASVANAAISWDRYSKLAAGAEATALSPKYAIISKEDADSALLTAIIDTAFVLIDAVGAAKAFKAAGAARALLEAGEAGAKEAAVQAMRNLPKGAAGAAAVEKAVLELGPQEASRISGKSFQELADIVGKESETGVKLMKLNEVGAEAAAKGAHEALEALRNLKNLDKAAADKAVLDAIDSIGYIETIKTGGGWKAVVGAVGGQSGAATKLEGWRVGLLEDLQKFLQKEEGEMGSKAVRTGTAQATSDLDVQAVGGAAGLNAEKAQQWLMARLGVGKKEMEELLDASILIDPTRSHLYDMAKGLSEADRSAIEATQTGLEMRLMFGVRLFKANANGELELADKIIAQAKAHGIDGLRPFEPLSDAKQLATAREIDGILKELQASTDPARNKDLVKKIGEAQAQINASNKETYLGGGVRIHVTTRVDVEKGIDDAKKLGTEFPTGRMTPTAAQRVMAALNEGKFFDKAIRTMKDPAATISDVADALKDLGKHGQRACEVAGGRGGTANAELMALGDRMKLLADYAKRPGFRSTLGDAAKMDEMVKHATQLLEQAEAEVGTAVTELQKTAEIAQVSAEQTDNIRAWLSFQLMYTQVAQKVNATLPASLEAFHQILRNIENDDGKGDNNDKANQSNQPAPAPQSAPNGGTNGKSLPAPAPNPEDSKPPDGQPATPAPGSSGGTSGWHPPMAPPNTEDSEPAPASQ